jgi:methylated-DNA-[protein]-cysteine S-methyltransferase
VLLERIGRIPNILDEAGRGEYYLDSIGVFTQFRGLGVGRALVETFCNKAFVAGHERVGLIVDYDNSQAERLYTSLGFERVGTRLFFKHKMWHLQRKNNLDIRKRVELSSAITPFQRRVYLELLNVPAGKTITYGELAQRIGCRSAQAVGQALKRNPFAPEVPCHRVVAADGSIGGYLGRREGEMVERKRKLLDEEQLG